LKLTNVVPAFAFGGQAPPKPWTMANVVLRGLETVAREIKGLDAGTRAWDIDFPA